MDQSPPDVSFSFGPGAAALHTAAETPAASQEPSLVAVVPALTQQQEHGEAAQDGVSEAHQEASLAAAEPSDAASQQQEPLQPGPSGEASWSAGDREVSTDSPAADNASSRPGSTAAAPDAAMQDSAGPGLQQQEQDREQQEQQPGQEQHSAMPAANTNTCQQQPGAAYGVNTLSPTAMADRLASSAAASTSEPAVAAPAAPAAPAPAADATQASTRPPHSSYFVAGMRAIDVEVDCGPLLPCRQLHVAIDMTAVAEQPKPFLGGFRHKHSGAIFHHASSQTPKPPPKRAGGPTAAAAGNGAVAPAEQARVKLSRVTQTVDAANTSCQTVREAATQMARPGLQLDCSEDRVISPRPYVSSEVVGRRREAAALTIQRYSRGWLARLRAAALRAIKAERDGFLAAAAAERQASAAAERRREVGRRTHPLVRGDFELLSDELEAWRQQQTTAIKAAGLDPSEEQAALELLLAKETRLLQTLDRLRVNARHENKARTTQQQLGSLAQPKTWVVSSGKKVMVHTPQTVRAAELQQLHRGLVLPGLSLDERLEVLLHVKWAVKEFDCRLTRELVELIDREADLLNRGRSPSTLDGLRKRIAGAFLSFCRDPSFNPEAARLLLVPGSSSGTEVFEYVEEWTEGDEPPA